MIACFSGDKVVTARFILRQVLDWTGKTDRHGQRHPALWHMLDVAAAASALWLQTSLARLSAPLCNALLVLTALHDLGKISAAFQRQIETSQPPPEYCRHWELTEELLRDHDELLAALLGGHRAVRGILRQAVAGHHGRPVADVAGRGSNARQDAIGVEAKAAAAQVIRDVVALFEPASLDGLDEDEARRLSWLLSGLVTQADWIGSNTEWFPFPVPQMTVPEYWRYAQGQAFAALPLTGLGLSQVAQAEPVALAGGPLRPMQQAVSKVALPDGPMLALVEDATGAGKTEAALILAQRMMAAGKGRGIYFALPSMASSEAMFERMRPKLTRLFDGRPSLALAHGRRALSPGFAEVRGNWDRSPEEPVAEDACAPWIADDRRLSLLAEIGVGTVDQVLMAVLPTRFHTLRMAALAGRILIVDEAHDYDPYMQAQLEALLRFHALFGGSAIVMTATLPTDMRQAYARAFARGLDEGEMPDLPGAYPALSVIGARSSVQAVDPVPATCRRVEVERLSSLDQAVATLAAGTAAGAACVWIRNSVADAVAAAEALRAAGVPAELLHARFAMCDRQRIELRMQARFGRDGQGRAGPVLVSTQILQASLDLDFDVMVSDLAPMGDLIQRAGRLWRHNRGVRPVPGPRLHLLSPDPGQVDNMRWIFDLQPSGGWVYPVDMLWRTARALLREGAIVAPDRLRALIAEGHGGDPVPEALLRAEDERVGRTMAETGLARSNLLKAVDGYGESANYYFDDRKFPTRLGEDQVVLILMRRMKGQLRPWADADHPVRALALSEVQIPRRRYCQIPALEAAQAQPEIAALRSGWKDWEREVRKIAVVGEDGKVFDDLCYDVDRGLLTASPQAWG